MGIAIGFRLAGPVNGSKGFKGKTVIKRYKPMGHKWLRKRIRTVTMERIMNL